jgi:hypothetical protein
MDVTEISDEVRQALIQEGMPQDPIQARRWWMEREAKFEQRREKLGQALKRIALTPAGNIPKRAIKNLTHKDVARQSVHLTARLALLEAKVALMDGDLDLCEAMVANMMPTEGPEQ